MVSAFTAAGQRLFNVIINGTQVLTNFDIYATAGGRDKAIQETFTTTADANGRIAIAFIQAPAEYDPLVNDDQGADAGTTMVLAIDCGLIGRRHDHRRSRQPPEPGELAVDNGETWTSVADGQLGHGDVTDSGSQLIVKAATGSTTTCL